MRISDWSSDVCCSDLIRPRHQFAVRRHGHHLRHQGDLLRALHPAGRLGHPVHEEEPHGPGRSEERRVGKSEYVRVDLGGRRIIKKKNITLTSVQRYPSIYELTI